MIATWLDREEWRRLRAQLPADVRQLGRRRPHRPAEPGTDVVTAVAGATGLPGPVAAQTVQAVVHELTGIVPQAAHAVLALLPDDLRTRAGTEAPA